MWLIFLLVISVVFIILATARLQLHPFLVLLVAAFGYGLLCGNLFLNEIIESVNAGFGGTVGSIGIVIIAGTIIGTFLEKSGGAWSLAERTIRLTGEKNVPLAMGLVGYIVSIPVFCDSGFVILSPLNRALSRKAGLSIAGGAIALSLGLYATHTMVPPTPGPVAAAGMLGADLGQVILWGGLVSLVALAAGWLFSVKVAGHVQILPDEEMPSITPGNSGNVKPTFTSAMLPILIPIVLIVFRSISELPSNPFGKGNAQEFISFMGNPVVALLIGVFLASRLAGGAETEGFSVRGWVGEAVVNAATIIIITGAGGAFGKVLQNSGIAQVIEENLGGTNLGIVLPFIIAAALKTAQGSSTVAIITTAGIMAPLLTPFNLETATAKALVVVAIGAGSMVVSHANDSYFWVVTQFSKMSVKQGYQLQTLGTLVEGIVAALTVWIISLIAI